MGYSAPIFLIGYRASGKSAVGRRLAERMGRQLVDTDRLVEEALGSTISEVFARAGEAAFRDAESEALVQAIDRARAGERLVVATGGGVVERPANREALRAAGIVVWLRASAAILRERMEGDAGTSRTRPALQGGSPIAEVEAVLARREPLYAGTAAHIVETGDLDAAAVAEVILDRLSRGETAS